MKGLQFAFNSGVDRVIAFRVLNKTTFAREVVHSIKEVTSLGRMESAYVFV